jgi:hypothetical protein
MTSIVRADNISTVAGTGTVTLEAGNTLDTSAGLVTPAGHVIQTVFDTYSTQLIYSSPGTTTEYDVGLSASITPTSTSSKILIITSFQVQQSGGSGVTLYWQSLLKRNGTTILDGKAAENVSGQTNEYGLRTTVQWLDQPFTTSTLTYTMAIKNNSGSTTTMVLNRNSSNATMTLMEIAG